MNQFKERLKLLRDLEGMTQKQLADAIKLNQSEISRWEKGIKEPNLYNFNLLAKYFNVSMEFLYGDSEEQ